MTPQLCLGTAQFGLVYGITNTAGQVLEENVAPLLVQAQEAGIRWLDTAQAYGNAEAVLGRQLPAAHRFRVISKLPAQTKSEFNSQDTDAWEKAVYTSCKRLGVRGLDALLLHAPADLAKPGGQHLEACLLSLRKRGVVKRLGVSIYAAEDLNGINPALLDLVQMPLSLYDQRLLLDGTCARLSARGTAIHARSLYLQGLLLTSAAQWPSWVSPEVRAHQQALEVLSEQRSCRLIDLALGFAQDQKDLEAIVLGVCNVRQLAELQQAWAAISTWQEKEWQSWALQDPSILDPRRWPR
ncbi:aldo/keto reductase [Synechococcus sp. AH-736-M20]|nr:aldo/keto reductase [Synechococcus sp. AH-736-M20]